MGRFSRFILLVGAAVVLTVPLSASAGHTNDPRVNLGLQGHIFEPKRVEDGDGNFHTDIAFWNGRAYQGSWNGVNVRNIRDPLNPKAVSSTSCKGPQGDVVVWGDILVRTWDVPAGTPGLFGAALECDGEPVPEGWEGLHIFDVSNNRNPEVVGSVQLPCGSHTATGVPDPANNRLLVYSSPSAHNPGDPNPPATCDWFDVVEVPLDNPGAARRLRAEPAMHTCHDIGVILGNAMRAACAGGDGVRVFSLGGRRGGSLENPRLLFDIVEPGVDIGHSAAWSWDGRVIVFGHEPGGGVSPECEETDTKKNRRLFFYDGRNGNKLGTWLMPRAQSSTENCTLHNYNIVPLPSGRDVVVLAAYQAGTSVVDFTDPAHARELAWTDPPPIEPFDIGGAWSSYWYNGSIYESNIGEGLNIFRFQGQMSNAALRLGHLNAQTQEFTIP